jgi:hypothetical protein
MSTATTTEHKLVDRIKSRPDFKPQSMSNIPADFDPLRFNMCICLLHIFIKAFHFENLAFEPQSRSYNAPDN